MALFIFEVGLEYKLLEDARSGVQLCTVLYSLWLYIINTVLQASPELSLTIL